MTDETSRVIELLERLFQGMRNDLYDRWQVQKGSSSLVAMNNRLGPAIEIEVDQYQFTRRPRRFTWARSTESQAGYVDRYPEHLFQASVEVDSTVQPGELIHLVELLAMWRGERLFLRPAEDPRVEVELRPATARSLRDIAPTLESDTMVDVYGRVRSTRARHRRDRLVTAGTGLEFGGTVRGAGAAVPDLFPMLRRVLTERRPGRIVCTVHGDLNPRNVLVVKDQPCVIDYRDTAAGLPLCLDFATLESGLLRHSLSFLPWVELVRLQRLLGVATHLGDDADDDVANRIAEPRLRSAYQVLRTVRRLARQVYPEPQGAGWWREYAVHLFLAAHVALRYPGEMGPALRAAVAMGGVAAEMLDDRVHALWRSEEYLATVPELRGSLGRL